MGTLVKVDEGVFVEKDVLRIAEKIREYDSNLRLQYLEHADSLNQAPYRILEVGRDGQTRLAFSVWELNDKVLERIYAADNQKFDVFTELEAENALAKKESQWRYEEIRNEEREMVKSIISSPKDTYTVKINDEVKIFKA